MRQSLLCAQERPLLPPSWNRAGIRGGRTSGRRAGEGVGRTSRRWSFGLSRSGEQGLSRHPQGLQRGDQREGMASSAGCGGAGLRSSGSSGARGAAAAWRARLQLPLPLLCWRHKRKLHLLVLYTGCKWTFASPNCLYLVGVSLTPADRHPSKLSSVSHKVHISRC